MQKSEFTATIKKYFERTPMQPLTAFIISLLERDTSLVELQLPIFTVSGSKAMIKFFWDFNKIYDKQKTQPASLLVFKEWFLFTLHLY